MTSAAGAGASDADAPADPDAELMARIARGDRLAYARLVDRHLDRAVATAHRMLGRRADAEDVAQEAFLRVWTRASSWEPGHGRVSTWLYRIVANLCLDQLRRPRPAALDDVPEPPDPAEDAEARIDRERRDAAVARAVAELPERQRAAVALSYQAGLSNRDAAEALGVPVGALESLLVRAKKTLRAALRPREEDRP